METQKASCSDQSPGEPIAKRAKPGRVSETSTAVESSTACSEEHVEVSEKNECVEEQNPEVTEALVQEAPEPLEGTSCSNCTVLQNTVRKLRNRIVSLENKAKKWKLSDRRSKYRIEGEYSVYDFVLFQLICENNEMGGKILPAPLFEIKY